MCWRSEEQMTCCAHANTVLLWCLVFFLQACISANHRCFFSSEIPGTPRMCCHHFQYSHAALLPSAALRFFSFFEAVPRALVYIYKIALFDAARHAAAGLLLGLSNSENASSASSSSSKDDKLYVLFRHVHGQSLPRRSGLVAKALGCWPARRDSESRLRQLHFR